MNTSTLRRLLALILALAMVFALTACAGSSDDTTTDSDTTSDDTQTEQTEDTSAAEPAEDETPVETTDMTEATDTTEAEADAEPVELIVFAAASMTETLTEIKDLYEAAHPNVTITYNFDSSGTLKTQIENGADCDIFISAAQKQMNQLDITASAEVNTDGLDFVLSDTRVDLLENKVALAVPEGNPAGIESYDDLAEKLAAGDVMLAMGNSDVPVGQYTQKILAYYGLDEDTLAGNGVLTYGSNVKEVTTQVSEATVDCGIIYATDAFSAGLTIVDYATAEMCGQVIYPAAVLNVTNNREAAEEFLNFLLTDEAGAIFESVGFSTVQ
jgi:molybdate transport system substrate-binding protein